MNERHIIPLQLTSPDRFEPALNISRQVCGTDRKGLKHLHQVPQWALQRLLPFS